MNECDKRRHKSSTLHMIYISSDNIRYSVTKTFTTLHPLTLHFTTLVDTSLPVIYTSLPSHLASPNLNFY
jgi:hypothetical protein